MSEFLRLLGFNFGPNTSITKEVPKEERSPITPVNEDGAVTIQSTPYYGTYIDLEGSVRNEVELITKYRSMSIQPELERAIDEVVNEAIQKDEEGDIVELDLDDLKVSEGTKERVIEEFEEVLKLLNFNTTPDEIFRRWYIDGRIYYHIIVNEIDPSTGIRELRYVDPRRIRKIREIQKKKDPLTGADVIVKINEYFLYSEKVTLSQTVSTNLGLKIAPDSIIYVNSSLMDEKGLMVLSYLHKAIKPLNNLRMVEDALVIYRLSRAPERRVFYIDVGNMPKQKADQYLYDIMMKYRNKLVYDASTGEVRDDRKHLNMMEDFWIPRRGEGKSTEISTLQSGQNLSRIEDAEFFKKKLYESLGIPVGRLNLDGNAPSIVGVGRSTEVTREELKFAKFIDRLRNKFSNVFLNALGTQLRLKNVCNEEEWNVLKQDIKFKWLKSNNFDELLEGELLRERLITLQAIDPYVGRYFSTEWVKKNVLHMNDEEILEMDAQIESENEVGTPAMEGSPLQVQQQQLDQQDQMQTMALQQHDAALDQQDAVTGAIKDGGAQIAIQGAMMPPGQGGGAINTFGKAGKKPGQPGQGSPFGGTPSGAVPGDGVGGGAGSGVTMGAGTGGDMNMAGGQQQNGPVAQPKIGNAPGSGKKIASKMKKKGAANSKKRLSGGLQ